MRKVKAPKGYADIYCRTFKNINTDLLVNLVIPEHMTCLGNAIPFPEQLKPIPANEAICGINNAGGRFNVFNKNDEIAYDLIGKQTREIKPDGCITNDGKGGFIKFSTILSLTKWAAAFRINDFESIKSNEYIIGNENNGNGSILINNDGYFGVRFGGGSIFFKWDGTGNTEAVPTVNGNQNALIYCDGIDIHLYYNGIYKGYLTPDFTPTLYVEKLINGYVDSVTVKGKHYDYRIWDFSTLTPEQINAWGVDACKFHIDNMPQPDFPYHKWDMLTGAGSFVPDSGTNPNKLHGTMFYDDINIPVNFLHNVTRYPEYIRNAANRYGYNIGTNDEIIPADMGNIGYDVLGNILVNKDSVKLNSKVSGGIVLDVVTTGKLHFNDLTGVSIVSSIGTSTPTINGNDIDLTSGTLEYLELSNGDIFYFNGTFINSNTGNVITSTDTTFKDIFDTAQSAIDSLKYDVYKYDTGEYVINPQYPLPANATLLKGIGYKGVGLIDMDSQNWNIYFEYLNNTVVDNSFDSDIDWNAGSGWIVQNGKAEFSHVGASVGTPLTSTTPNPATVGKFYRIDISDASNVTITYGGLTVSDLTDKIIGEASNTDDLVIIPTDDNLDAYIGLILIREVVAHIDYPNRGENLVDSLINGGTTGSSQYENFTEITNGYNFAKTSDGWAGFTSDPLLPTFVIGEKVYYDFDIHFINRGSGRFEVGLMSNAVGTFGSNKITPIEGNNKGLFTVIDGNAKYFASQTDEIIDYEITNIKLYKIEAPNEIGHLPSNFFNKLNVVGNIEGRPEYWLNNDAIPENVYLLPEFSDDYFRDNIKQTFFNKFYFLDTEGTKNNFAFYPNSLSESDNKTLVELGYKPDYFCMPKLPELLHNSNFHCQLVKWSNDPNYSATLEYLGNNLLRVISTSQFGSAVPQLFLDGNTLPADHYILTVDVRAITGATKMSIRKLNNTWVNILFDDGVKIYTKYFDYAIKELHVGANGDDNAVLDVALISIKQEDPPPNCVYYNGEPVVYNGEYVTY